MAIHTQDQALPRKPRTQKTAKSRAELLHELDQLPNDARIDETYVAAARGCSLATVQRDRTVGQGVPFIADGGTIKTAKNGQTRRFGGRVYYLKRDLMTFLEERNNTYRSTTESDQHRLAMGG